MNRYALQNSYPGFGAEWQFMMIAFESLTEAVLTAAGFSLKPIYYGAIRVVDSQTGKIVIEYPAGEIGKLSSKRFELAC